MRVELSKTQIVKKKKGLCITPYCRRYKPKKYNYCYCCIWRRLKERDYPRYVFYYLKQNARRRGKEFFLTIEEFKKFCVDTGYIEGKGRLKNKLSIDRIDNTKGYSIDNIRILTVSENSKKGIQDDCPF